MTDREISTSIPSVPQRGFVVIDTETTGLHADARVIELGMAYLSTRGNLQKTYSTLLFGDGTTGEWAARRVHRIRRDELDGAPHFKYIASDLQIDSSDYAAISIANGVIISSEVRLLTHDYSVAKEFMSIGHAYPIYFDHRVADSASSLPYFYVLGRVIVNRKPIYLNSIENSYYENFIDTLNRLIKIF